MDREKLPSGDPRSRAPGPFRHGIDRRTAHSHRESDGRAVLDLYGLFRRLPLGSDQRASVPRRRTSRSTVGCGPLLRGPRGRSSSFPVVGLRDVPLFLPLGPPPERGFGRADSQIAGSAYSPNRAGNSLMERIRGTSSCSVWMPCGSSKTGGMPAARAPSTSKAGTSPT